jgi:DNA-directed RNA polymerase specialized sigma24 family protein
MGPELADELWSHRAWLTSQAARMRAKGRGDVDADDLAQETQLWAWEHWDRRQPHWHLRYWLWLILRRNWIASLQSRDRQRRIESRLTYGGGLVRRPRTRTAPRGGTPVPVDTGVYDLLAGLSDKVADVAEARYLGGYTYDETAVMLGLPVSTVTGRLNLARQKLARRSLEAVASGCDTHRPSVSGPSAGGPRGVEER